MAATGGSYAIAEVEKHLRKQWPASKIQRHDKEAPSSIFSLEHAIFGSDPVPQVHAAMSTWMGDITEALEQEVLMIEEEWTNDAEAFPAETPEILALQRQMRSGARTFAEARDLLRRRRVARRLKRYKR